VEFAWHICERRTDAVVAGTPKKTSRKLAFSARLESVGSGRATIALIALNFLAKD
jgi:hypothetical protein